MIASQHGRAPILILAPHGGISRDDLLLASSWPRKGNDLHTSALARELAEALDASCVVNTSLDRNHLDLNRISEAARTDSDFAARMTQAAMRLLENHARIRVLVIHGWHIQQKKVDLGVGARLESAEAAAAAETALTCGAGFVRRELEALRHALHAAGVETTFGERWPAAHRNNLLQIFREHDGPAVPPCFAELRSAARAGRIDAVQVELGAPLRWVGRARSSLVQAVEKVLGSSSASVAAPALLPTPAASSLPEQRQAMLQFHDARAGVTLLAGMACLPGGAIGSRLLAFLPDGQTLIFTGHGTPRGALAIHGFRFDFEPEGFRLEFDQAAHATHDPTDWFRREEVQALAGIEDVRAHLRIRSGHVAGEVRAGSETFAIDTPSLPGPMAGRPFGLRPASRHQFAHGDGKTESVEIESPAREAPGHLRLPDGREARCAPLQTARLLRTAESGALLCEFGPARYEFADGRPAAHGIFEHITRR